MTIKRIFRYIYFRVKFKGKLIFSISDNIGMGSIFEGANKLSSHSSFSGVMGFGSYLGDNSSFTGKIGRYTSIGPRCKVISGSHPYTYPFVSTSPIFYSINKQCGICFADRNVINTIRFADADHKYLVVVGNDCWINADVRFVSGVTIGDGAIVLAGAVVTKDVPPYAIVGGVPAKVIKYRYETSDIKFLLDLQWWNKKPEVLSKVWPIFNDFSEFRKQISIL